MVKKTTEKNQLAAADTTASSPRTSSSATKSTGDKRPSRPTRTKKATTRNATPAKATANRSNATVPRSKPAAPPTGKRRTRLSPEQRRNALLDAAAQVVVELGVHGLSMEAVTERAGVSRALGYFYFENTDLLVKALYKREFGAVYEALKPALEAPGTLEDRVRAKVHAYFDVVEERHDLFAVLNTALDGPEYRRERHARYRWWEAYLAELVGGEFDIRPEMSRVLARLLMAVDGRCVNMWYRDRLDRADVEELCVRFQLGGLRDVLGIDPANPN